MSRRTATASFAVLGMLALAPAWVATAGTAAAATETMYTDFDNDGLEDVVVGVPGEDLGDQKNAGRVEIRYGDGHVQGLHLPHPRSGDRFGAGISAVDDGHNDLLVGAPGRDVGGKANAGSVYLFTANQGRLSLLYGYHLGQQDDETDVPGTLQAGARLGATLASGPAEQHWWGADGTVYVGAPNYDTGGSKNAGAVVDLTVSAYLQEELTVEGTLLAEGSGGVPGTPHPGDVFGTSISRDGVLIGAPGKAVGGDEDAGAVFARVPGSSDYRMLTQDTAGVPGGAERGDRFGAATLALDTDNARGYIGAPGEAIGSETGAGSVVKLQLDELTASDPIEHAKGLHEGKGSVQGSPEAGDHFGAALGDLGSEQAIAGAPDEDVHGAADAGMVFRLGGDNVAWSQNSHGVPGHVEQGDRFGAAFGKWGFRALVGIPGENGGAGSVLAGLPYFEYQPVGWHQQVGASESGDGFGSAMTYPYP